MDTSPPLAAEQQVRRRCGKMVVQSTIQESEEELIQMDCLVDRCDVHIAKAVKDDPVADRLSQLRGVGH